MRHPRPEALLDLVEGTATEGTRAHVEACDSCCAQLAQLHAAFAAVADVDVPEPSPLFWNHFSSRVREAIADEPAALHHGWIARWLSPSHSRVAVWAGLAGVVAVLLVVGLSWQRRAQPPAFVAVAPPAVAMPEPLVELQPAASDDASLMLLADLAGDLDWDSVAEAGLSTPAGSVDRVVAQLSATERVALQRVLTAELASTDRSL